MHQLPELVQAIQGYDGDEGPRRREITREAMLFTLLTWCRTSETRFAAWHEFEDIEGKNPLWRIPGEWMKMEREHIVPLVHQVVLLLRRRLRDTNGENLVFPGTKPGKALSQNTMIYACYRMGYRGRQTVHGFRGMASTWANEQEIYNSDWIEMALAHSEEDDIRGAYNSALYLTPRRRMLQHWADTLSRCGEVAIDRPRASPETEQEARVADLADGNVIRFPARP
nr:site-specific integrase [Novosphingobium panipatense]